MKPFYTDVRQLGNTIFHSYFDENGNHQREKIEYSPVVYSRTTNQQNVTHTTIYGEPLQEHSFETIKDCRIFVGGYNGVDNVKLYGNGNYAYQFLSKQYPEEIEYDSSLLDIAYVDIETEVGENSKGFADGETALEKITLITIKSTLHGINTFGYKPYTGEEEIRYVSCDGEVALLKAFIRYWISHYPHIITDWNGDEFDIPYLYNRICMVLGVEYAKKLSPFNIVKSRTVKKKINKNKEKVYVTYDLYGIQHLDYMILYKKFVTSPRENYKLDTIGWAELKRKKLKNPEKTFKLFYLNAWNTFVLYNIQDVDLIVKLEAKKKLIQIALKMSFIAKVNFGDCVSPVKSWDSYINNYLLDSNIIPPLQLQDVESTTFPGAFVKEPKKGLKHWSASFDAKALYPSIIAQWNISPETFIGIHPEYNKLEGFVNKEYDLSFCKEQNITIAANGAMFSKEKQGFLPKLMIILLDDRDRYKGRMLESKKIVDTVVDVNDRAAMQVEISILSNFEQALKLFLNSCFGSIGNEYFKFFSLALASAITLNGQLGLKHGERHTNAYMNNLFGTDNVDYNSYSDTDSFILVMNEFIDRFKPEGTVREKINFLDKVCSTKIAKELDKCYTELFEYTNGMEHRLYYKREVLSSRSFWLAKKKYAMLVENSEGVEYDPYYIKIMGLQVIQSSTPECVRDALKYCVELILTSDNDAIIEFIQKTKEDFFARPVHEIAFPRGVNEIDKWEFEDGGIKSGCPIQVRAAIAHNRAVKKLNLGEIYPKIEEGDKFRFCYMRTPNPLRQHVIGFMDELPEEFGVNQYIDYNTQFNKTFIVPIGKILDSIGWDVERKANIFSFFNA